MLTLFPPFSYTAQQNTHYTCDDKDWLCWLMGICPSRS